MIVSACEMITGYDGSNACCLMQIWHGVPFTEGGAESLCAVQATKELATCRTDLAACRAELARTRLLLSAARAAAAVVQNSNPVDGATSPVTASAPAAPGAPTQDMGAHSEPDPQAAASAHGSCSAAERAAGQAGHTGAATGKADGTGRGAGASHPMPASGSLSGDGASALPTVLQAEGGGEDPGFTLGSHGSGDGARAAISTETPALRNLAQALALAAITPTLATPGPAGGASGGDSTGRSEDDAAAAVGAARAPLAGAGWPSAASPANRQVPGASHVPDAPVAVGPNRPASAAARAAPAPRSTGFPGGSPARGLNPSRTPRASRRRSAWDSPLPAAPATGASTAALARALSGIRCARPTPLTCAIMACWYCVRRAPLPRAAQHMKRQNTCPVCARFWL